MRWSCFGSSCASSAWCIGSSAASAGKALDSSDLTVDQTTNWPRGYQGLPSDFSPALRSSSDLRFQILGKVENYGRHGRLETRQGSNYSRRRPSHEGMPSTRCMSDSWSVLGCHSVHCIGLSGSGKAGWGNMKVLREAIKFLDNCSKWIFSIYHLYRHRVVSIQAYLRFLAQFLWRFVQQPSPRSKEKGHPQPYPNSWLSNEAWFGTPQGGDGSSCLPESHFALCNFLRVVTDSASS